jgi:hypothetical protein
MMIMITIIIYDIIAWLLLLYNDNYLFFIIKNCEHIVICNFFQIFMTTQKNSLLTIIVCDSFPKHYFVGLFPVT